MNLNLNTEGVAIPAGVGIIISAVVGLLATQFGWTESVAETINIGAEWIVGSVIFIAWVVQTFISRGQVWSKESHDEAVDDALNTTPPA